MMLSYSSSAHCCTRSARAGSVHTAWRCGSVARVFTRGSRVLTPMYNCARIKLTAPRDGCKLRSMSVIIPAGGSHDQEQDSEYHTRISSAREVHSRHRHHVRAGQEYGAQISASSGTVGDAPSAAQPSLQTGSVQRANPEVGSRGSLLQ